MEEAFSQRRLQVTMNDLTEEDTVLDVLHDIFETERNFYGIIRFLDGHTRNHIVAAHLRNVSTALQILRDVQTRPPPPASVVMNIDLSGNLLRSFMEPVPVVPTRQQIVDATETHVGVTNTVCAICQETVACATRIRACGHCFHSQCIEQWLGMNTRCPVCRHDIREPLTRSAQRSSHDEEDRGVHSNEE
jgi:hypothetical protein